MPAMFRTATAASCPCSYRAVAIPSSPAFSPSLPRTRSGGGYAGRLVTWACDTTHITLEIIRRGARAKGFEVLPRRWVVERTFAWIFKNRRLVRDYEQLTEVAETLITIAASATLIRRWQ